jgi:AraC-like DNA-binding protein
LVLIFKKKKTMAKKTNNPTCHRNGMCWYGENDFAFIPNHPYCLYTGILFFCVSGKAVVGHNLNEHLIEPNMKGIIFPRNTFYVRARTPDFRVKMFTFTIEAYDQVRAEMGFDFTEYLRFSSVSIHDSEQFFTEREHVWEDITALFQKPNNRQQRIRLMRKLLGSYMVYLRDRVQLHLMGPRGNNRRREYLYQRFLTNVTQECRRQRDLKYYADRLRVSTRYLYTIAHAHSLGKTPKDIINQGVLLEAKMLLESPENTIADVARTMNFPSESYFSRYFKQHTGVSPSVYRVSGLDTLGE